MVERLVSTHQMRVSIIIPVLNEEAVLEANLKKLQMERASGHEIIVVDGGSEDDTQAVATPWVDQCVQSSRGRALQMNKGAAVAAGDVLLFLHADTLLPDDGLQAISRAIGNTQLAWGRFNVRLSGDKPFFRVIETMMNWRSRITGIATGDQAIFVTRGLFHRVNGFTEIPLMEDIDISRRLKKLHRPCCLKQRVITSSRRWELGGTLQTILLMWRLRLAYWLGTDPATLARQYR